MIAKATQYEGFLKALGAGAFGKLEYDGETRILLRTAGVKTTDLSGTVRVYFNSKREQVMSGRRFDPMGSGLLLLRPGLFYRICTTITVVEPLPQGVSALVVLNDEAAGVMLITTGPFREGFVGPVAFTIQPFRKIEVERMTSFASLMFFEETANVPSEWLESIKSDIMTGLVVAVKREVKAVLKGTNSDRAEKSVKSTGTKKALAKK